MHQEGRAVRSSLNYLLDQLDRQLAADRAEKKQGYDRPISMRNGLTLDTLIIGHYEPERKGVRIDRRWPAPIWPIEALKLPPCPDDERLNHSQYNSYMKDHSRSSDRQADGAATIKRWIDVCLYWLATGSMPNDYAPNQQIQSIIRDVADVGKQREWTFRSWFRRPIREATFCLRDEARTDKLDTPRRSCDVDGGPAVLAMSAEEDVVRLCETYVVCRVEADNCDDYIPFLEQTAFTDRVSFTNCRIENENGELAPCVILNCHFQKGLNLSGIDASCVILRNCTFEGGDPLKDLSTRTYERGSHRKSLRLDRVRAETIRIEDCLLDGEAIVAYSTVEELQVFDVNCLRGKNAAELTIGTQTTVGSMLNVKQFHAMCVNITIGRYSAASGRIELDVAGEETVLSIEKSKFHGAPRILLQDHASAKVHSTTVDDTMFVLITRGSTHSDVLFRECRLMSDVVFLDDKRTVEDDPSATLPAERPTAVFADCHLERSLKVHPLCLCDLTLSDTKILRDLRFFGPSQSLRMDSVIVGGFLRLTAKEDFRRFGNLLIKQSRLGGITAEELQFTGDVMITSSTITGAISFSDSHFDQAVTLGDPEASKTLHFESGLRKLRIVRDGVEDADDASFSIHQHEWSHVICQEELSFIRCVFRKDLDLSHLICSLVASLQGATFEHDASLIATQMRIGVYLDCESTTFCGNVLLREADISGELEMRSARFFGEQLFLEETNCGRLDLSYATFLSEPAPGDAAMSEIPSCALRASRLHTKLQLDCQGTRFGAVVDLSESEIGAEVDLSGADLRACETLCFRRASMRTSVDLSECLWDNPRGSWRPLKRSLSFLFSRKSARAVPHVDFSGASITRRLSIQKPYRHREEGKNGEEIRRPADPIWIKLENANLQDLDVSNSVVHYSFRRSLGMKALSESWPRVFWLPVFVLLALWRVLVLWTIGEIWMTGYSLFQLMIGKGKGDAAQAKANMARLHKELASRKMDYGNVDRFHCWESWFSFFPGVRLMSLFAWRHGTTWKLPVLWMALLSLFSLTVLIMSPVDEPFSSEVHWRDRARTGFSEFWRNEDSTSYHLVASALIEIYPEFLQEKHRTQATSPTTPAPGSDAHAAPETAGLRAVHGLPGWAVTLLACSFVCKCLFANLFFVALFRKFVR